MALEIWEHTEPIEILRDRGQIVLSVKLEDNISIDIELSDREANILGEALVDASIKNGFLDDKK